MKLPVINTRNEEVKKIDLPKQFNEPLREDLIQKAVVAAEANARQPYGSKPEAGMRYSSDLSKRRRDYRGSYGHGISRVPRKILSARGTRFYWVGATAPGTVGGRRAHPPKAEKEWHQKINDIERSKAIRSAISASLNRELVEKRGHIAPEKYPFIIDDSFEKISKTKELRDILLSLGFKDEMSRNLKRKVSEGKAKIRGRKRKVGRSILIVLSKGCDLQKAAKNIYGIETVLAERLNTSDLAPGCQPGRLILFTESAIEKIKKDVMFMKEKKRKSPGKREKKSPKSKGKKKKVDKIKTKKTGAEKKEKADKVKSK